MEWSEKQIYKILGSLGDLTMAYDCNNLKTRLAANNSGSSDYTAISKTSFPEWRKSGPDLMQCKNKNNQPYNGQINI